jgi:pimeloyl-ACP methyl ester carboxylesterase
MMELSHGAMRFPVLDEGEGETVVLLHGFPDCYRNWVQQVDALSAAGYRAVAPALRGYAPECLAADGDYSLAAAVEDLIHHVETLGSPVHLVGHDWGAVVSQLAAARSPHHFRSLTSMAIPPVKRLLPAVTRVPRQLWLSAYMEFFQLPVIPEWWCRRDDFAGIRTLWDRWSPDWDASPWLEQACETLSQPGVLSAALGWYRHMVRFWTPAGRQTLSWLKRDIQVPTLLMMGRKDGCMSDRLLGAALNERDFPAGVEVEKVAGAGHFLQLERPDRVNDLLIQHLRRHAG